ncbi:cupin domain-containing protein [Chitinispirillales bacterium ANBcel5]|uniref:hypothetical protein n=1 Tax=Cellulosispirillum alkaliphilum TaxID=3039283 RepID=UPI002A56FFFA|nr:cupin domain-containing protein [Chitinispirillales bacterium ANBcel5]
MAELIKKSFESPEKIEEYPGLKSELVNIGGIEVYRMTFKPGWSWVESIGSQSCDSEHIIWVVLSGRFAVRMNDGTTQEFKSGDIATIPPGHTSWVIGEESVVALDIEKEGIDKTLLASLLED